MNLRNIFWISALWGTAACSSSSSDTNSSSERRDVFAEGVAGSVGGVPSNEQNVDGSGQGTGGGQGIVEAQDTERDLQGGAGQPDGGSPADAGTQALTPQWVGAWATGLQLTEPNNNPPNPGLANNTLRQNMFPTLSGERVRVRFSNEYGSVPVVIEAATIATSVSGSEVQADTIANMLFANASGVTIPVGEAVYSDPVRFEVQALQTLTVTTAFGNIAGGITGHPGSRTTSFLATGGDAVDEAVFPTGAQTDHWYIVSNIDVERDDGAGAMVILGDSITDGRGSVTNENTRWPDFVARNLQQENSENAVSVLNLGIGGNSVLQGGLGPTARERFDRQVLDQPGVRWVVVLEGVNDLGAIGGRSAQQMADNMISAYEEFIDKSHAAGLLIYGATILPFAGSGYGQNQSALDARNLINDWILSGGQFDATIDFTPAVATPGNDQQLLEAFIFQNDFLHLNPAGLEAMGNAVDLSLFAE